MTEAPSKGNFTVNTTFILSLRESPLFNKKFPRSEASNQRSTAFSFVSNPGREWAEETEEEEKRRETWKKEIKSVSTAKLPVPDLKG